MAHCREYIGKVARTDSNVLITGETGTGKEKVARAIHFASTRRQNPFVTINCAAIPDSLLESELFGFVRGAFTGAMNSYAGKLVIAKSGTILLDEIGEMSASGQAKILRVVETREIFPIGAPAPSTIDVRFIAATNQALEPLVTENRFRRDLYYRLNVARLQIPPLRERRDDIQDLLRYFISDFNQRYHGDVEMPDATLLAALLKYDWPGNVRELRNLVESLFIDPPSGAISRDHLPESFRHLISGYVSDAASERDLLVSVLGNTHWNKKRAASEMHWSRMTLYRKLAKYNIRGPN
jgi:two-component system response regulator HydG